MSVSVESEPAPVQTDRYKFRPKGSTWGDFGPDVRINGKQEPGHLETIEAGRHRVENRQLTA